MDVSKNNGTPKLSILIGFSIVNHPFWCTPIFGNTQTSFYSKNILGFMAWIRCHALVVRYRFTEGGTNHMGGRLAQILQHLNFGTRASRVVSIRRQSQQYATL